MRPSYVIAGIAVLIGGVFLFSKKANATASEPGPIGGGKASLGPLGIAKQLEGWNVFYLRQPGDPHRVLLTAQPVPGYGHDGQSEQVWGSINYESEDQTYGVVTAQGPGPNFPGRGPDSLPPGTYMMARKDSGQAEEYRKQVQVFS